MSDAPKLTRLQVDAIRANTNAFIKQHGADTTVLMPMLPKRLLIMCDTIDELYDQVSLRSAGGS